MKYNEILKKNLSRSIQVKNKFIQNLDDNQNVENVIEKILDAYKQGGKLYIAGNGGSAADAQHMAAEFVSRFKFDRDPLPAEALTVDTSIITAIGNDYGFDKIFSRQIECKVKSYDIFLGISTSGNSKNIINAFKECKKHEIKSILLSGEDGGDCTNYCDYKILVPSKCTAIIQEIHIIIFHTICEVIENNFLEGKFR